MRIGDLHIDIPATWEDHSLYSFVAPPEDAGPQLRAKQAPFRRNVVLQRRPVAPETTLADCVLHVQQTTARDFGAGVKIDVEDGPPAAGGPTRRLTYRLIDPVTTQAVAQVVYVALVKQTEWQIAFSAPAAGLKADVPRFDEIVRSIQAA
jgi:hypothetical protein